MKAKILITAASILFSISIANANPTRTSLIFWDSMGKELIQPFMAEETADCLPFEVAATFNQIKHERVYRIYDLSELSRPEKEEPLPFDLETVYRTAKK